MGATLAPAAKLWPYQGKQGTGLCCEAEVQHSYGLSTSLCTPSKLCRLSDGAL